MSSLAEVAIERRAGTIVAHVDGDVDMTNAAHVRDGLLEAVPNDALALAIDLERCRYLDSAAIEVVFELARRLTRRRQDLRIVLPRRSPLTRVVELTDVGSVARIFESVEDALEP